MAQTESGKRRALIVEDQTTFRELLAAVLEMDGRYAIVSCGDGKTARAQLERADFDLVLLDLVLPDMHGFELFPLVKRARTLVLTAQARPAVVRDAMERGAHGVLTKGAPLQELREAIDRLTHGGVYYSSESSKLLHEATSRPERDELLTDRQREILRCVASGLSTKEIAQQLSLSEKTVTNHRARIMERLGLHDVASLTRYAIQQGLVDPAP